MFALSLVADGAIAATAIPEPTALHRGLSGSEYRFPVQGAKPFRLPKDVGALAEAVAASGSDAPLLWTTLTAPTLRIPLRAEGSERRAALVAGCRHESGAITVAAVRLTLRPGPTRQSPPVLASYDWSIGRYPDGQLELLESLWLEADPAARAAAVGASAIFLAGNAAALGPTGKTRVQGVCAALGLEVEVVVESSRHVRQVATRIGSGPPSYLIVWRPQARGVESAVAVYRESSAEGEVVELAEESLDDALLELRWALLDHGLDGSAPHVPRAEEQPTPRPGEERFYIKYRGSKGGDVMVEVDDCGHGQWGSDQRRKAPRALKGIAAGVGANPVALFLCAKCSKHRWRARY